MTAPGDAAGAPSSKLHRMLQDRLEAITGHLKETDFMGRTESILHPAQDSVSVVPVTFERQHHIDEVFQQAWDRPVAHPS